MNPRFTATFEDEETWRLKRLEKAHLLAQGFMANYPACPSINELVVRLHDHKGQLYVIWRLRPTSLMRQAYSEAWGHVEECENQVEHQFPQFTTGRTTPPSMWFDFEY
jgi:hypothetical protein